MVMSMNILEFKELVANGPVLLDGATGSNLMSVGMPTGACTEQWVLEHPDTLIDLQRRYVKAGTQIIYAPTFSANCVALKKYKLENQLAEMIPKLVALSKTAANDSCYVAGDLTTTGDIMITYDEALSVYEEQISHLAKAGVDLLIAETMLSKTEALAAVTAAKNTCDLPFMCSFTIMPTGFLYFGGTILEVALELQEAGAAAVGINCSAGPTELKDFVTSLSDNLDIPVILKPNAGMPEINAEGKAVYNMSSATFSSEMKALVDLGATIVGGCCGTTPEYIEALKNVLAIN